MQFILIFIVCVVCVKQCVASEYSEISAAFEQRFRVLENTMNEQEGRIRELERVTQEQQKVISLQQEALADYERTFNSDGEKEHLEMHNRGHAQPHGNVTINIPNTMSDHPGYLRADGVSSKFLQNRPEKERSLSAGRRQNEAVAFTVTLTHHIQHLGIDQPVVFDLVVTNEGNHYNVHTGVFTAPMTGMYAFSFYIASYNEQQVWVSLVVDGRGIVQGIADSTIHSDDIQGGNFAVVKLEAGESVWIKNVGLDGEVWASVNQRFVSFSGFLLH